MCKSRSIIKDHVKLIGNCETKEVKSIWTYMANIEKNKLKEKACREMGMEFEYLIYDYKGNRIFV